MCGLLVGLLRARRATVPRTGLMVHQRARYLHGKPPKVNIGPAESVFVLTVFSVVILGPSCWILSHLEDYKSRG